MERIENNSVVLQCESFILKIENGSCVEICTPYKCGRGICYIDKNKQPRCSYVAFVFCTFIYDYNNIGCKMMSILLKVYQFHKYKYVLRNSNIKKK